MFTLSANHNRWRISEDGKIILSGIGSLTQAINIARLHGIVLTEFLHLNHLKKVA